MPVTVGVLSILEGEAQQEAQRLWQLFEDEYASTGVQSFAHPNLTFQAGLCRNVDSLGDALIPVSQWALPFELTIDGLAFFPSPARVSYLRVRPSDALREIHRAVNLVMAARCDKVFTHYAPEIWIPHVTVAMGDLSEGNMTRAMRDLATYHPVYRVAIGNMQLVQRDEETGRIHIVRSYPGQGPEGNSAARMQVPEDQ